MKINLINDIDYNLTPSQQILFNRGIPVDKIHAFLNTTDEVINDYKLLDNIKVAAEVLLAHLTDNDEILIQVDSDVDGYTSSAVMYNWIKGNFPQAKISYQVHDEKTHGLNITEDILNGKYQLIIVPDAGSNEYEKHRQLFQLGINVIILDHHDAEYASEHAYVVNNQLSEDYPNKALSGVGVTWQFCRALDNYNTLVQKTFADDYLDLVALGLIADMMDTRELETKRLIEKGIEAMKDSFAPGNSFLKMFIEKQSFSLKGTVTQTGLAWFIAPFINSVVRVGTPEERLLTFEAMLEENSRKLIPSTKRGCKGQEETVIEQAIRTLTNVKSRQKKQTDDLFAIHEGCITDEYLDNNSVIVLNIGQGINPNLKGLVANKISAKYERPAFIVSTYKDKEEIIDENGETKVIEKTYVSGSARNIDTPILKDFKGFIHDSGMAEMAEGHASAFGVRFKEEKFQEFLDYATASLDFKTSHTEYNVDFIFDGTELQGAAILDIAFLTPYYGQGIKESFIAIKNLRITDEMKVLMSRDKNPTLKLMLNDNIEIIKFRCSEEEFASIAPNKYTATIINLVGKCTENVWGGEVKPQILVEEYEIVSHIVAF